MLILHRQLGTGLFTPHLQTAIADTKTSLQSSKEEIFPVSEVYELLTNIHDILDGAHTKLVGKIAHILAYLINSAPKQHQEVWV